MSAEFIQQIYTAPLHWPNKCDSQQQSQHILLKVSFQYIFFNSANQVFAFVRSLTHVDNLFSNVSHKCHQLDLQCPNSVLYCSTRQFNYFSILKRCSIYLFLVSILFLEIMKFAILYMFNSKLFVVCDLELKFLILE